MSRTRTPIPTTPSQEQRHVTMDGLARLAEMLDKLSDQVRASQKAITDMQRALFWAANADNEPQQISTPANVSRVVDEVMNRVEVCRAFGINPSATTTLKRRQDALLMPRGNHIMGQQAVTWWKSDIDTILRMMRCNTPDSEIRKTVSRMNAKNASRGGEE